MLPRDPMILPSYLNTLLRDKYTSLSDLCDDLEEDLAALEARMSALSWQYDRAHNQFVRKA